MCPYNQMAMNAAVNGCTVQFAPFCAFEEIEQGGDHTTVPQSSASRESGYLSHCDRTCPRVLGRQC